VLATMKGLQLAILNFFLRFTLCSARVSLFGDSTRIEKWGTCPILKEVRLLVAV
jgi:hypothetical protein